MGLGIAYIIGKLFFSFIAAGMGNNRRCGTVVPLLLSLLFSPIVVIPWIAFGSQYKNTPDKYVFLRDEQGNLVPDMDEKGKQRLDKATGEPLWMRQHKDDFYYKQRERRFLRTLFVTPSVALLKYTAFLPVTLTVRGIRSLRSGGQAVASKSAEGTVIDRNPVKGIISRIPEEVYKYYDSMGQGASVDKAATQTVVVASPEQGVEVKQVPVVRQDSVPEKMAEESHGKAESLSGYRMPDGSVCILCPRAEMAALAVRLVGTEYEGCRLVSPKDEKDLLNTVVRGRRDGFLFTSDLHPVQFNAVLLNGRIYSDEEFFGVDRSGFDRLLETSRDVSMSFSRICTFMPDDIEIQCDEAYSLRTDEDKIELTYSGMTVASIYFDPSTGQVSLGKCDDDVRLDLPGNPTEGTVLSDPMSVLDVFRSRVMSDRNIGVMMEKVRVTEESHQVLRNVLSESVSMKLG